MLQPYKWLMLYTEHAIFAKNFIFVDNSTNIHQRLEKLQDRIREDPKERKSYLSLKDSGLEVNLPKTIGKTTST